MNSNNIFTKDNTISFKKLNKKLLLCNLILLIGFFAVQILITSSVGTQTTQGIDYTRNLKAALRQENSFLDAEVAKEKSLSQAQSMIEKYGLQQKDVNFLQEANLQGIALNYQP